MAPRIPRKKRWPADLPVWLGKWANTILAGEDKADQHAEVIHLLGRAQQLTALLSSPSIASKLGRLESELASRGQKDIDEKLKYFLTWASMTSAVSDATLDMAQSEQIRDLQAVARASQRLSRDIQRIKPLAPGADDIDYLNRRMAGSTIKERLGLRATRHEGSDRASLATLLDTYAADMADQISLLKKYRDKYGRKRLTGRYAARNQIIDRLLHVAHRSLGSGHYTLIADIVATITGCEVDASAVTKRANEPRKLRAKDSR